MQRNTPLRKAVDTIRWRKLSSQRDVHKLAKKEKRSVNWMLNEIIEQHFKSKKP